MDVLPVLERAVAIRPLNTKISHRSRRPEFVGHVNYVQVGRMVSFEQSVEFDLPPGLARIHHQAVPSHDVQEPFGQGQDHMPAPASFACVPEGEISGVGISIQLFPALGMKRVGLVPELGVAVAQQRKQQDVVFRADPCVHVRELRRSHAQDVPRRGKKPERLKEDVPIRYVIAERSPQPQGVGDQRGYGEAHRCCHPPVQVHGIAPVSVGLGIENESGKL
ncbi:hypothetical protein XF35_36955 [Streptomyces platensis subsp. clarensis]|nr:hypothetical protein [Streptomyces platensis subsp. clarensis]